MINIDQFNYKQYRIEVVRTLKEIDYGEVRKKYLKSEKKTIQYQIAKKVKEEVTKELKNLLSSSKKLNSIQKINAYFYNIDLLVMKIKSNYIIFNELPKYLKKDHYLNLELLKNKKLFYKELTPKELLNSKEFLLKAIDVCPRIVTQLPKYSKLRSDFDIIEKTINSEIGLLSELHYDKFKYLLFEKYPLVKKKYTVSTKLSI